MARNQEELYGFINQTKEIVIPFNYTQVGFLDFNEGVVALRNQEGFWGYVDEDNNTVIPFIYKHTEGFSGGLASVSIDGKKYGFIDKNNTTVIPFEYEHTSSYPYITGLGYIRNDHIKGLINAKNELVIPCEPRIFPKNSQLIFGENIDRKYGACDYDGNIIIPFEYSNADLIGIVENDHPRYIVSIAKYIDEHTLYGLIVFDDKGILSNTGCIYSSFSDTFFNYADDHHFYKITEPGKYDGYAIEIDETGRQVYFWEDLYYSDVIVDGEKVTTLVAVSPEELEKQKLEFASEKNETKKRARLPKKPKQ